MIVEGIGDDVLFVVGGLVLVIVVLVVKTVSSGNTRQEGAFQSRPGSGNARRSSSEGRSDNPSAASAEGEDDRAPPSSSATREPSASDEPGSLDDRIDVIIKTVTPEQQFVVSCSPNATIAHLKERAFPDSVGEGRTVRLIFRGRLLGDTATLSSVGITDHTVIHAQISSARPRHGGDNDDPEDLSRYFIPLLAVVLIVIWLLVLAYPQLFSTGPRVMLVGLTAYFAIAFYNTTRTPTAAQ